MKFLKALKIFIIMYRRGFYFSSNVHTDPDKTFWGFFRFNFENKSALFDIDFSFAKDGSGYFHLHGDDFRLDRNPIIY